MIDKIRNRLEGMVQDDAIKNIIPHFKPHEDAPEWDPVQSKVVAPGDPDYGSRELRGELSTMLESRKSSVNKKEVSNKNKLITHETIFENWRKFLK